MFAHRWCHNNSAKIPTQPTSIAANGASKTSSKKIYISEIFCSDLIRPIIFVSVSVNLSVMFNSRYLHPPLAVEWFGSCSPHEQVIFKLNPEKLESIIENANLNVLYVKRSFTLNFVCKSVAVVAAKSHPASITTTPPTTSGITAVHLPVATTTTVPTVVSTGASTIPTSSSTAVRSRKQTFTTTTAATASAATEKQENEEGASASSQPLSNQVFFKILTSLFFNIQCLLTPILKIVIVH